MAESPAVCSVCAPGRLRPNARPPVCLHAPPHGTDDPSCLNLSSLLCDGMGGLAPALCRGIPPPLPRGPPPHPATRPGLPACGGALRPWRPRPAAWLGQGHGGERRSDRRPRPRPAQAGGWQWGGGQRCQAPRARAGIALLLLLLLLTQPQSAMLLAALNARLLLLLTHRPGRPARAGGAVGCPACRCYASRPRS